MIEFDSRSEERVHNFPNFCVKKSRLLISCRATFVYQKNSPIVSPKIKQHGRRGKLDSENMTDN